MADASFRRDVPGHTLIHHLFDAQIEARRGSWVRIDGRWLLNFVSTNYLGLANDPRLARGARGAMRTWGVSLGAPRRLAEDPFSPRIERALARRMGQPDALLFPSTTHAARDTLRLLCGQRGVVALDAWAYPISLEAARLAALEQLGEIRHFKHQDATSLTTTFCGTQPGRRLTIVCDGVYPATGEIAPLRVLLNVARRFDARVYVDDAHGFGVLGQNPEPAYPYGRGGGGAARFLDVSPGRLVQVSSLSKAFGAPLAVVAGPSGFVRRLRAEAGAMIHSSPPAIPTLAAAAVALVVNGREGDERRRHLARMVCHLRDGLARVDVPIATPGLFPIQSLHFASPRATFEVATHLRKHGIWCVADFAAIDNPGGGAIRFVLSAAHSLAMIDEALERIVASLASSRLLESGVQPRRSSRPQDLAPRREQAEPADLTTHRCGRQDYGGD